MEQELIDKTYAKLAAHEKEIADHNELFFKTLSKRGQKDFRDLIEYCSVTEKISIVDEPKGSKQLEDCGVFKDVHVEQWTTNMDGDSYAGFIYANLKGQWIEIPFSC